MVLLRYNKPALQVNPDDIIGITPKADDLNVYLSVVLRNGENIRCYHIKDS